MNKRVVRVDGHPWVLAFGWAGGFVINKSFDEEIETYLRIGASPIDMPAPFRGGAVAVYRFEINVFDEQEGETKRVPAFLLEYCDLTAFDEMPKKPPSARDNFMLTHVIAGGNIPLTIDRTIADITRIQTAFVAQPWGDFQAFYHRVTGAMWVFDPQKTDPNRLAYQASMTKWLVDIAAAQALRAERTRAFAALPPKPLLRRNSLT